MIDLMAQEAIGYINNGYHVQDAVDMAIANHITASAYPTWMFGRVKSKVLDRISA